MKNNIKMTVNRPDRQPKAHHYYIRMAILCSMILLTIFSLFDFVKAAVDKDISYEIRYETEETLDNEQILCRLYINGEYYGDVDSNLYSSVDENGNADIRYCFLIERVRGVIYSVIISAMLFVVVQIAENSHETPFTHNNTKRIRLIGILQFALAIVPGAAAFIMKFVKFTYTSSRFDIFSVYMFMIGCVIMLLAQVFDYGVKLQEDNDLIA